MAHVIFKAYKIVLQLIMDKHVLIIWKDGTLQLMDKKYIKVSLIVI